MTNDEFEALRVQTHQNSELLLALLSVLADEFDGLAEDIRDKLMSRVRYFAGEGASPAMAAATRDLATSFLLRP